MYKINGTSGCVLDLLNSLYTHLLVLLFLFISHFRALGRRGVLSLGWSLRQK